MKLTKKQITYGFLILILLIAAVPWLKEGIPVTDDYRHHAMRVYFIQEQIAQGEYSEWMPHIYNGWPFLHFYHPLFYLLALPAIALFNTIAVLKVMTVVIYAIALIGTFYAGKLLFKDDEIALFASIAYFLSGHFLFHATVSGALPRLLALAILPLAAALCIKAIEEKTKKNLILAGVSLAALLLSHMSVAVPVFIIVGIWMLYDVYWHKNVQSLGKSVLVFIIAIALSAAWLLPLLAEKEYANLSENANLDTPLLDQSLRTFGITHNGQHYVRSNYFGYSVLALTLLGLFFIRKNKTINLLKIGLAASTILYFNAFNIMNLPLVKTAITGSTTYFIGILVFNAVGIAAVAAKSLAMKFKKQYLLYVFLLIVIVDLYPSVHAFTYGWTDQPTENFVNEPRLIEAWNFVKQQEGTFTVFSVAGQAAEIYHQKDEFGFDWIGCPQCVQKEMFEAHRTIWSNFTNGFKDDELLGYLGVKYFVVPCQYKLPNKLSFSNNAYCVYENEKFRPIIESTTTVSGIRQTLDGISFTTESEKKGEVLVKITYFEPHWNAFVNGKETKITKVWPAFMLIDVPAGKNAVSVEYTTNGTHLVAWFITFLTGLLIIYYWRA
jgi:hypothetical protein